MNDRPNVLLICADQWRADCLSAHGHPVVHTPNLDALCRSGVSFDRAYSATPVCIPARVALMTGLSQQHHGRLGYQDGVRWEYPVTLAGEFTRHGYQTQAIGKMHVSPQRLQLGFQNVILHDGYGLHSRRTQSDVARVDDYVGWLRQQTNQRWIDDFMHGVHNNSHVARPWPLAEHLHPTNWTASEAQQFLLRRDPTKPFFLYLSFHRPHPPYDPPEWAFQQAMAGEGPPIKEGNWTMDFAAWDDSTSAETIRGRLRPDILRRARAGYFGHILHLDQQINRVLYALKEQGLQDNTWICFTSDHGELLGDHYLFRKSLPYDSSARIPLILHGPDLQEIRHAARSQTLAELRDIMPTLLGCAGLPAPAGVDGKNLLPAIRDGGQVRPFLHGELTTHAQSVQWLTDGREKYLWFSGTGNEQLFDLVADPNEETDLARLPESPRQKLEGWRSRMVQALADRPEGFVRNGKLTAGARPRLLLQPASDDRMETNGTNGSVNSPFSAAAEGQPLPTRR